jgi:phenylalanine-4-hydroxylase
LQVSGIFTEVTTHEGDAIYLRTTGPSALAFGNKELPGHGRDYHAEGFGGPIGPWKSTDKSPETLTEEELASLGITVGKNSTVEFASGVVVHGHVENILRRNGKLLLIAFTNCRVTFGDRVLFEPAWGNFDMAVGARIASVFNGAADKDAYNQVALVPRERTIKVPSDAKRRRLESLYAQVRDIREHKVGYERLGEIWETQQKEHADDWLLSLEIFEILDETGQQNALKQNAMTFLNGRKTIDKDNATLIEWGFRLVIYHKAGLQPAERLL